MNRIIAGAVLLLALAGCGGDSQAAVQKCLFEAVDAYPTWSSDQPVLDTLKSCKDLPQADRTHLRQMVAAFVAAGIAK